MEVKLTGERGLGIVREVEEESKKRATCIHFPPTAKLQIITGKDFVCVCARLGLGQNKLDILCSNLVMWW